MFHPELLAAAPPWFKNQGYPSFSFFVSRAVDERFLATEFLLLAVLEFRRCFYGDR
jgi:hypothetical protein